MRQEKILGGLLYPKYSYKEHSDGVIHRYVTGREFFNVKEYEEAFDSKGNKLGEICLKHTTIDGEQKTLLEQTFCKDTAPLYRVVLFGLEFKLLYQNGSVHRMDDVELMLDSFQRSFNRKFFLHYHTDEWSLERKDLNMFPWVPVHYGSTRSIATFLNRDEIINFKYAKFKKSKDRFLKRCIHYRNYETIELHTNFLFDTAVNSLEAYFLCKKGSLSRPWYDTATGFFKRFNENINLRDRGVKCREYHSPGLYC